MSRSEHWSLDPREVDRLIDRELEPSEQVLREAEAAGDESVAGRVARRREFLRGLCEGLSRDEAARRTERDLAALEEQVRRALEENATPRTAVPWRLLFGRRRPLVLVLSAAAVLVVGLGIGLFGSRPAEAMPPELVAAELLRTVPTTTRPMGACGTEEPTSPFRFPLVAKRELRVEGCIGDGREATKAVLLRLEDLAVVGFVAVPDEGAKKGPEIGVTRFEDVVVFDVPYPGARYFLAVDRESVDRRGACASCHGPVLATAKNPHYLKERRLPGR